MVAAESSVTGATSPASPTVSAVIPAFNSADRIVAAVRSVLDQTAPPSELIVVDDGSTDSMEEAVRRFGDRVRYVRQRNRGPAGARNRGIELASGQWIAFLDDDDRWHPDRLEHGMRIVARHPELVWVFGGFTYLHAGGRRTPAPAQRGYRLLLRDGDVFPDFYQAARLGVPFSTCAALIRRDTLLAAGGFCESLNTGEDRDLWYRIADRHAAVGFVDAPLFVYDRRRPSSLTRRENSYARNMCALLERHVPPHTAPSPDASNSRDSFFGTEIRKALRHAIRTGRTDCIRWIMTGYGAWLGTGWRALGSLSLVLPPAVLATAGRLGGPRRGT